MTYRLKQFRPGRTGIHAALHDLEAAIMDVVWRDPRAEVSVRDVLQRMLHDREIAYTTVMTTMDRLAKMEVLDRRKDGRAWIYRPAMTREEFLGSVVRQTLRGLPATGTQSALAWFVEQVGETDRSELDHLAELIDEKRRERGGK
jgi:predicted transcriptional regulator